MKDIALIATAYNNEVRVYIGNTTNLVEESRKIHKTWPTASAAFGRFLTTSVLMGLMYKDDERLYIKIEGEGPIGKMIIETTGNGKIKGDIQNPEVYLKYNNGPKKDKLAVGLAVGQGNLHVTKDLNLKSPFASSVKLQSGEIAEDFAYYFALSEQTPTVVSAGVLVDTDESILASGGFIVQLLPGASEDTIVALENIAKDIKPMSTMINEGMSLEGILKLITNDNFNVLKKEELYYECDCSRQKYINALSTLDLQTLTTIKEEDESAEIECHFCKTKYIISKEELTKIIERVK